MTERSNPTGCSPHAAGSISIGLHAHEGSAVEIVEHVVSEARRAAGVGFDGVTFSEHHGGFPGYLPNPIQMAALVLEAVPTVWSGPSPSVLPLRAPATVVEDLAWMAARHPGRVGAGFATGYQQRDFDIVGADFADRSPAFWRQLRFVVQALSGRASGALADDPAVSALGARPVPVVAGIGGPVGARRAADRGAGILVTSLLAVGDARRLVDEYRAAGGVGPVVLIRRAWVGDGAPTIDQQLGHYRDAGKKPSWMERPMDDAIYSGGPDDVAGRLSGDLRAVGADSLNIRMHTTGIGPDRIADQIDRFAEVVDLIRP